MDLMGIGDGPHIGHRTVKLGLIPDTESHLEPCDGNRKVHGPYNEGRRAS